MKSIQGLTLIELMVTLAVVAILLVVGVPSYRSFVQENRAASQTNAVVRALTYARSEAIKRAEVVTICQSNNQSSCGGGWADGWIIFSDVNQNGSLDTSSDTLLQSGGGLSGNSTLTASTGFIRFAASGAAMDTTQYTLTPADCKGDMERLIKVSGSGEITTQKTAC